MSKDQVEEILKRTDKVQSALNKIKDHNGQVLEKFFDVSYKNRERALKESMKHMVYPRNVPDNDIERALDITYHQKKPNLDNIKAVEFEVHALKKYMFNDDEEVMEDEEHDPHKVAERIHDRTLQDMKEDLLEAVNNRKSKVLQVTLEMFNNIQEKTLKTFKLNTVE
jgi:hypothetical protein